MTTSAASIPWQFKILIDGDCPLCAREAAMLRRMDKGRHALAIEDIADPAFDPSKYGLTHADAMARIRGVTPDGEVVEGVEVFRRAYKAVGWGWLLSWTAWPIARPLADAAYRFFAKHRLRLTGRAHCTTDRCAPAR